MPNEALCVALGFGILNPRVLGLLAWSVQTLRQASFGVSGIGVYGLATD